MSFLITKAQRFTILMMLLCLCASHAFASDTLTIAVASSYYKKAESYSIKFEKLHDVKVRLIAGSTGRLYNQIKQGLPFDVFIAADQDRAVLLNSKNKLIGYGGLGMQVGAKILKDLNLLTSPEIKKIVIANPKTAPFGKAAKNTLEKAGLWQLLQDKIVYAQNAVQASMMVNKGIVDAGFVPREDDAYALARVPYIAVLLSQQTQARSFFKGLTHD